MHIVFRADASTIIGIGHVMRCLSLAHQLAERGANISFLTRKHSGNIIKQIKSFNYQVVELEQEDDFVDIKLEQLETWLGCSQQQDAQACITALKNLTKVDYLVVDHYAIDQLWHKELRCFCQKIMVIDDLANRIHDCDFLLDQTLHRSSIDYLALVPNHCQLLLGQPFMLLREEFSQLREQAILYRQETTQQKTPHILVTMGGGDPENLSQLAIDALSKIHHITPLTATVVLSSASCFIDNIILAAEVLSWLSVEVDCQYMAKLMIKADIAIGASGSTAWERCCLGLPSITLISADNQNAIADSLSAQNAVINLGWHENVSSTLLSSAVEKLIDNKHLYQQMVEQCFTSCDGKGVNNVIEQVFNNV